MTTWRRLLGYIRPYLWQLVLSLVAMVLLAITTGLYPILLQLLAKVLFEGMTAAVETTDKLVSQGAVVIEFFHIDVEDVRLWVRSNVLNLFAAIVLLKTVCQAARFYLMGWIAQCVIRDLRAELFGSIVQKGTGDQATGYLVSRVVNDVTQVERAATYAIPILIGDVLKVVALATVCLWQYQTLVLLSLGVMSLAVLPIVLFGKLLKRYAKRSQEALAELTNRITETLGGIRVVHTYGREQHEIERFDGESGRYLRTMMKSVLVRAVQTPAMELIGVAALLITILYALGKVESNELDPADVVGFLIALILLYEPVKAIGRINAIIMPGMSAGERVFEVIDRAPDVMEQEGARPLNEPPSKVRFEEVGFAYGTSEFALKDLNLDLPQGKIVALVGPSGGGKSTVATLLPRLFDVTSGKITFDGVDIRDLTLKSLRQQIAMVAQETYLFNDSVRANIAYGDESADKEAIEEAAKQAFAHEFITALPEGYDTNAGERGVQLSGGQRQRIAIARAFLRDAPILVLDEATSALDVESERVVQQALDALLKDRTALVIAHRLSTIRRADEIVFLQDGQVMERGTHEDLLTKNKAYARLVAVSEGQA